MKSTTDQPSVGRVVILVLLAAAMLMVSNARAGTLENLERERAIVVQTLLDADLSPSERQSRLTTAARRLIDLERMALRDDKLTGRNTPTVRRAFENYDLTFMASAAAEHNLTIVDNWLTQLGLTTQSLMATNIGRR